MDIKILTLHRYYIWADRMRAHYDEILSRKPKDKFYDLETFLYMSCWYGLLYVVIEGWKSLNLNDPIVNSLLDSENVDFLRKYRNGVFHFQPEYFNNRFKDFISSEHKPVSWIRLINQEIGRYFLEQFKAVDNKF